MRPSNGPSPGYDRSVCSAVISLFVRGLAGCRRQLRRIVGCSGNWRFGQAGSSAYRLYNKAAWSAFARVKGGVNVMAAGIEKERMEENEVIRHAYKIGDAR